MIQLRLTGLVLRDVHSGSKMSTFEDAHHHPVFIKGDGDILRLRYEPHGIHFELLPDEFRMCRGHDVVWSINLEAEGVAMEEPFIVYVYHLRIVYVSDFFNHELALHIFGDDYIPLSPEMALRIGSIVDPLGLSERDAYLGYRNGIRMEID